MSDAVVLEGSVRDYAWGRPDGLHRWTGKRSGGPEAELWFGTHAAAPSPVVQALPAGSSRQTNATVLVKILAANSPLSIQIHPDQAAIAQIVELGHAATLADRGEKAEMLVAIEHFEVLAGFRPLEKAAELVHALGHGPAAAALDRGEVSAAVAAALGSAQMLDVDAALTLLEPVERAVLAKVVQAFPDDRGIVVALMMQPHVLEPGDAVAVSVGTVHAYVEGLGVEVMTSSDNVLRLGLTPKPLSVEDSLLALSSDRSPDVIRHGDHGGTYDSPLVPFVVSRLKGGDAGARGGDIILALDGLLAVSSPLGTLQARAGQAVFLETDAAWSLKVDGVAFVAHPRRAQPAPGNSPPALRGCSGVS